ncbi:unnamed protein product [marine sediment metagenome]|uniref:Transposase IS116/IS110/IS902 C-terminal domain-containing protein n=1 Tax=marine sediment metagenome TaxID=412755 RepID=X0TI51_9ZZZZ
MARKKKVAMCERCGEREVHHLHHKDRNHKNNKESNKEYLCTLCHGIEHGISPAVSELRFHLVHYERVQQLRIMISNNITAYSRIEMVVPEELQEKQKEFEKLEKAYAKTVVGAVKNGSPHPEIRDWLLSIKGIGELLAAKLLAVIDPEKMPMVASLWHFAGYAPEDVKRKGKKSAWNQGLKKAIYQIGDSFIKQRTPKYRKVYDVEKARQIEIVTPLHPKGLGIKAHADMRARRKMVKEFMKDLWVEWKEGGGGT